MVQCVYNVVNLWDLRKLPNKVHRFEGHQSGVQVTSWSPFSEYILGSSGKDRRCILWEKAPLVSYFGVHVLFIIHSLYGSLLITLRGLYAFRIVCGRAHDVLQEIHAKMQRNFARQ